jgi:hypothetical protein
MERQILNVSLWGSADGTESEAKRLISFRPRQYCGVYSTLLNLANHRGVRYLRVQWSMQSQGRGERVPLFGFQVFLEESGARLSSSASLRPFTQALGAPMWPHDRGHAA